MVRTASGPNYLLSLQRLDRLHAHDLIRDACELLALCGLGPKIPEHVLGWTPFHGQLALLDPVGHEEIANRDVLRSLGTGSLAILLQQDGALVVLENNALLHTVALCFQKIPRPQNRRHQIIDANNFRLCGALGVQLLLSRTREGETTSHGQTTTSVVSHVGVDSKGAIHVPFQHHPCHPNSKSEAICRVPHKYFIMWTNLVQSCLSGARTHVLRKDTAVPVSGQALLVANNVLATRWWNCSAFFLSSFSQSSSTTNRFLGAAEVLVPCSSGAAFL